MTDQPGEGQTSSEPEKQQPVHYIGLNAVEGYGDLVQDKWAQCCTVLDNLISFDNTGEVDGLSLVSIMESVGISEGLDTVMQSVQARAERTGKALTKNQLANDLFATVQQIPTFPIHVIFDTAVNQNIEHQTMLVIGLLGRGKSALCQYLCCGEHDAEDTGTFVSGDMGQKGGGVTQDFWVGHYQYLGKNPKRWVTVIDTPGGNDEQLPNFENFRQLQSLIKKIRYINTILLVVTAQDIMRRTESLNTYMNEFALTMQQESLHTNVCVVISRGHMVVPAFFPTEERFEKALDEAIMIPLKEAFGQKVPSYRLSMSKLDYMHNEALEKKTKETAGKIYEMFLHKPPLDCQKMVSLETRIKRLIQKHVALEEAHKQTQKELSEERATLETTQDELSTTQATLSETNTELERTNEKLNMTSEDLERWREKHSQCFKMLEREQENLKETREKLDSEREKLEETRTKWENEVKHHHETQERLEIEIRNHKDTKTTLETEQEKLAHTTEKLDTVHESLKETEKRLEEQEAAILETRAERDRYKKKAEGSKMCVVS